MSLPKVARVGVRLPRPSGKPGAVLPGWKAAVYDLDTGVLLPVESADLNLQPGGIVTATVRLHITEVTIEEPGDG